MIKYRYTIGNQMIETLDVNEVPQGLDYETIEYEEVDSQTYLIEQALEIDSHYTNLISDLLRKHIEKLNIDGIPIPQAVIDERDRLKEECNQKILDLGLNNFNYRKQNIRL